jgi:hypothetical protein
MMIKGKAYALIAFAGLAAAVGAAEHQSTETALTADDYIQIQRLYAINAQALDRGQGELFASTFTDDAVFVGGRVPGQEPRAPIVGRTALARLGGFAGRRHFTSNVMVTGDAREANGSSYLLVLNVSTNPATLVETAIYDDQLVKTARGWKFKRRIVWRDDDDKTPYPPRPLEKSR